MDAHHHRRPAPLAALLSCATTAIALCGATAAPAMADDDASEASASSSLPVSLGPRPYFLIDDMDEDNAQSAELKATLEQCAANLGQPTRSDFSIGHRGAPLMFPEHTRESYLAAARMGAGVLECDVGLYRRQGTGLPPLPVRPARHHQYSRDRACRASAACHRPSMPMAS